MVKLDIHTREYYSVIKKEKGIILSEKSVSKNCIQYDSIQLIKFLKWQNCKDGEKLVVAAVKIVVWWWWKGVGVTIRGCMREVFVGLERLCALISWWSHESPHVITWHRALTARACARSPTHTHTTRVTFLVLIFYHSHVRRNHRENLSEGYMGPLCNFDTSCQLWLFQN